MENVGKILSFGHCFPILLPIKQSFIGVFKVICTRIADGKCGEKSGEILGISQQLGQQLGKPL
jgi:hypothetical protein